MQTTWVLVADASRARVFSISDPQTLTEVADFAHPESRQHDRDLASDQPGRSFDSAGQGRHAMEPTQHPHEHEADTFALQLAEVLEQGRNEQQFQRLMLIAPPAFLGRLRNHLGHRTAALVGAEIDKDLTHADAAQLRDYILERL